MAEVAPPPADLKVEEQDHHDVLSSAEAGPSKPTKPYRFQPGRYAYEPPQPPPTDHKVEEEQAAQAAAQAAGYEGRRMRRFLQRRTVDYMGAWIRYREKRLFSRSTTRNDYYLKPSPHHVVDLLPSAAARSPASVVAPVLVHTSTNKIRTPVNVVTWMPSSRRLLTGSSSGEFTLWNGLTFNFETILQACDHGVRNLVWSSTGNLLLSGDAGGTVKYFLPNMNNVLAIEAHRESVRGLSFSPDDQRWVSGSDDSSIKMFNTERGVEETTLKGHGWDVKCVQWHPFKGLIASGGKDNLVKFWDPRRGGREIGTYHGHKNTVQALSFSPAHVSSSEILATASRDQTVKLYDLRMIREVGTLRSAAGTNVDRGADRPGGGDAGGGSANGGVCSLAWHPHAPLLSSGLSTGALQHHSLAPSANPELPISTVAAAHDQSIWAMNWHPLGQILVTGGNDCLTRWWQRERLEMGDLVHQSAGEGVNGDGAAAFAGGGGQEASFAGGLPGRRRPAYDADDDADSSMSFIPGLGGGAAAAAPSSSSSSPFPPSNGAPRMGSGGGGRAPLPPGFDSGRGGWGPGGRDSSGPGAPPPRPPHATGANMDAGGVRDVGWGSRSGGAPPPNADAGYNAAPPGGMNGAPPGFGMGGGGGGMPGPPPSFSGGQGGGQQAGSGRAPPPPGFFQQQQPQQQGQQYSGQGGLYGGPPPQQQGGPYGGYGMQGGPSQQGQPPPGMGMGMMGMGMGMPPPGAGYGQPPPQQQQQQQRPSSYGYGGQGGGGYGR